MDEEIIWIQEQRLLQLINGFVIASFVELTRPRRSRCGAKHCRARAQAGGQSGTKYVVNVSQSSVGESVVRIFLRSFFEVGLCRLQGRDGPLVPIKPSFQVRLVRFGV